MDSKIKGLRSLLLIGTIILFIAGTSFLFVTSVESYIKTTTMFLISLVFGYLSYYEENTLNFKKTSVFSYILTCIGLFFTYATIGMYQYFGSWFSFEGDGVLIFLASLSIIIALLLLVSTVRYKVYKLIELSIWFVIIAGAFIIMHFEVDARYIIGGLLLISLLKNILDFTNFSKWYTLVLCVPGVFSLSDNNIIATIIISVLMIANALYILYHDKKIQILPIILMYITFLLLARIFNNLWVFIALGSLLDLCISYTKVLIRKDDKIVSKIFINGSYALLLINGHTLEYNFVLPIILLATSLLNIYVSKDNTEEYIIPFKVLIFTVLELYYLPLAIMKEYLIVFISNIVMLFMYFLAKKRGIKNICLALLGLINIFIVLRVSKAVYPNVVYLVLFALDFYIIYTSEEKGKLPLSILFIVYSLCLIGSKLRYLNPTFALYVAIVYLIYLCITRKNRIIFITSMIGFIVSSLIYTKSIITDSVVFYMIANILILFGIILSNIVCMKDKLSKIEFIGILLGFQTYINLFTMDNIIFKIFALVLSIGLILTSIKLDDYKGLYYEGIIGVIISLLVITSSIASLPKSLYLIVLGLTIVCTIPFLIKKYLVKQEELKKIEAEKQKELEKELKKQKKSGKPKTNFCPECGSKVIDAGAFCSQCGFKMK